MTFLSRIGAYLLSILLTTMGSITVEAKGGGKGPGGTGGGETSYSREGKPLVRDLGDPSNCIWVKGDDFVKQVPEFDRILKRIESVHWYFAHVMREEAKHVFVCKMQAQLKYVSTEDRDSLARNGIDTGVKNNFALRVKKIEFL